jgi:hypothetical protein
MTLKEYRPVDSRCRRQLREAKVRWPEEALQIDWVKRKGGQDVEENSTGEYWYVLTKEGWVVGLIFHD